MIEEIRKQLLLCHECQTKTTRLPNQKHSLASTVPGYPFQILSLDFVGPLPPSRPQKFQYLLTLKCTFTKWLEAFPIKQANAETVVRILTEEVFPRFGRCERLHSDTGTQFTSGMFQELGKVLNIQITTTPPYNPCLLYTSPSPRDKRQSRMPSSA